MTQANKRSILKTAVKSCGKGGPGMFAALQGAKPVLSTSGLPTGVNSIQISKKTNPKLNKGSYLQEQILSGR